MEPYMPACETHGSRSQTLYRVSAAAGAARESGAILHRYNLHPSESGLMLQRQDDGQVKQDRLTVHKVSELNLRRTYGIFVSVLNGREQDRTAVGRGDPRGERLPGGGVSARNWLPVAV
jgi:hypothetical protein